MEFIACGVPVAGTNTRGIIDEVRDPAAICQATPQALAALIEHYASDPHPRSALAALQYAHAHAHYTTSVTIAQYLKLY
jgi:glycosyltransferase involved in cell wall biosynthesis